MLWRSTEACALLLDCSCSCFCLLPASSAAGPGWGTVQSAKVILAVAPGPRRGGPGVEVVSFGGGIGWMEGAELWMEGAELWVGLRHLGRCVKIV